MGVIDQILNKKDCVVSKQGDKSHYFTLSSTAEYETIELFFKPKYKDVDIIEEVNYGKEDSKQDRRSKRSLSEGKGPLGF